MLLMLEPSAMRDAAGAAARSRSVAAQQGGESKDKAAGAAIGVDQVPEWYQWALGVQSTEVAGGRTVIVRADGIFGFGQEASWWSGFSARTEALCNAINAVAEKARLARETNAVQPGLLVLDLNTPGGMAAGWSDLVGAVRACKAAGVQIEALVHDRACSLGMMLALLADRIVITGTATLGSLGVMVENVDLRKMYDEQGVAIEAIVSDGAEAKTDGAPYQGLSDAGREQARARVNALARQIIADIAAVGGKDAETLRGLFDGTVHIGGDAVTHFGGLVAGIVDPQTYIDALGRGEEPEIDVSYEPAEEPENDNNPEQEIPVSENKQNNVAATAAQIKAVMGERYDAAVAMGYIEQGLSESAVAAAETARTGTLLAETQAKAAETAAALKAAEAKAAAAESKMAELAGQVEKLTAQMAAVTQNNEQARKTLEALAGKAVTPVAPVKIGVKGDGGATGGGQASGGDFESLIAQEMESGKVNRAVAVFRLSGKHPQAFAEWQKVQKG